MSLYDFRKSIQLGNPPFYALLMAAMRLADDVNILKLKLVFPEVWEELQARYDSPGDLLPDELKEMSGPEVEAIKNSEDRR